MNKRLGLAVLPLLLLVQSCDKTTAKAKKKSTTSTSTSTGTGTGTGGNVVGGSTGSGNNPGCYAKGVGSQPAEYYTTPTIVQKGKAASELAWSSATDTRLAGSQNLFMTDSRFNVRVLAHPSPGKGTFPGVPGNVTCKWMALPYTKLQMKVRLRSPGSPGYLKSYMFNDIPVDGCSQVFEFEPPPSSQPWVMEVYDVKWDYSCIQYTAGGFPDVAQCPWDSVWVNDCYEMSLQWSTDNTRDIPH